MYILPAIDIIEGKCVRLIQGDYDKKIDYNPDPVKQALEFKHAGAQWLHLVDLDGAKAGKPVNTQTIKKILIETGLKVEVGGGIRTEAAIKELLDLGVTRVIIGTKAVESFYWFSDMANKYPDQISLGLDARGDKVSTHGWRQDSNQTVFDFAKLAAKLPIAAIIYTDISKDGMLTGPNIENTKKLADSVEVEVVASGGINSIEDIKNLKETNSIAAAITGRALYEGTLNLEQAINLANTK